MTKHEVHLNFIRPAFATKARNLFCEIQIRTRYILINYVEASKSLRTFQAGVKKSWNFRRKFHETTFITLPGI